MYQRNAILFEEKEGASCSWGGEDLYRQKAKTGKGNLEWMLYGRHKGRPLFPSQT